jgi:hypothetical protein
VVVVVERMTVVVVVVVERMTVVVVVQACSAFEVACMTLTLEVAHMRLKH